MTQAGFTLFETRIGLIAIVSGGSAILGLALPEVDEAAVRARVARRFPGTVEQQPDSMTQQAITEVRALLEGKAHDFSRLSIDLSAMPAFNRQVYALTVAIPPGETRTYGELARMLGDVGLSRAVGRALGENPIPVIVPCHRILAAQGRTGGFSAPGGLDTKFRLLNIELAFATPSPGLFGDSPLPLALKSGRT